MLLTLIWEELPLCFCQHNAFMLNFMLNFSFSIFNIIVHLTRAIIYVIHYEKGHFSIRCEVFFCGAFIVFVEV